MKKQNLKFNFLILTFAFLILPFVALSQGVVVNTDGSSRHPSAILDLQSTDMGFLLPRMTTNERNSIVYPAEALKIYNTTTNCLQIWMDRCMV
jgi:hypothetical protein